MQKKINLKMVSVLTVLFVCAVIGTIFALRSNPATEKDLTVHFKWSESAPYLYYDTAEGENETACAYPGIPMTDEGNGWYSCTLSNVKSAKVTVNVPGVGYATIATEKEAGEWWLDQGLWYSNNPDEAALAENTAAVPGMSVAGVKKAAQDTVTVHMYSADAKPSIYYWNALPVDQETAWPGKEMTEEKNGWYSYQFDNCSKVNLLFLVNGQQSEEFTRTTGEWWYDGSTWSDKEPNGEKPTTGPTATTKPSSGPSNTPLPGENNDFREETIYFVMTTRFYDGDSSNNVHCTDDKIAGNGDDDPAWRGDFKGLIEKLDYIKALGFSAVWITPVVENASSYDFHGYHAINFKKVDPRLESSDADYQTLINEAHKRDMKIIQDIVLNHTSNNGEEELFPIMKQEYTLGNGVTGNSTKMVKNDVNNVLDKALSTCTGGKSTSYENATPDDQYHARDYAMKSGDLVYRKNVDICYEGKTVTTGQFAPDCIELNTEYPGVYKYLIDAYNGYIDMGVDAFRIDTVKHISRLTFNKVFLNAFKEEAKKNGNNNFYMYGEVAKRVNEFWINQNPNISPAFYTWKEEKDYKWNDNSEDGKDNLESCFSMYDDNEKTVNSQRTSQNTYLKGNEYHTPDYSEASGMGVIDYNMHFKFLTASDAFNSTKNMDQYYNDATYNVVYVDSHDYGPNDPNGPDYEGRDKCRYNGGTDAWAENMCLMFTFRGIPCLYYGSEVEFQKGARIDCGNTGPLKNTGRAYFGDYIEGTVNTTDFSKYSGATGAMADTLNKPLSKQLQRLNQIRRSIPALQKGQYSIEGVNGNMAFKRRYTDSTTDSFVCVAITDAATFNDIPNGTYQDVVTGKTVEVTNGTLSIEASGKGNMRVYVLNTDKTKAPGKIGEDGAYLK